MSHEFSSILCLDFAGGKKMLCAPMAIRIFFFRSSAFARLFKTTDIIHAAHKWRAAHTIVTMTRDKGFDIFR